MHCKIGFMFLVFADEIQQRCKARKFPNNIINQTEMQHINGFTNISFFKMTDVEDAYSGKWTSAGDCELEVPVGVFVAAHQ
jgi:hypothetical protein